MGEAVATRRFEISDVPAAVALEKACQPRPWSEGVFLDELGAENRSYVTAARDGLIGFGGVMVVGDEAHITNLLVAPEQRRRGVGRSLLNTLVDEGVDRGARHLTLEVRSDNTAAIALYQQFGLVAAGTRPRYYGEHDALIMWAHDIDLGGGQRA